MTHFPHPLSADEDGLLAIGGDLSLERLRLAYSCGIFPWYNQPPILWWFTHPRCVMKPDQIKISKSMRSLINNKRPWVITANGNFQKVINRCSEIKRRGQQGTWISAKMKQAYISMHQDGRAHSIEVWDKCVLIGGLYGVISGRVFYGESMFSDVANASKYAFIHLTKYLTQLGCVLIDCQQDTPHMRSLGATLMNKEDFWNIIKKNMSEKDLSFSGRAFKDWLISEY